MTALYIACAITTAVCAIACGALCAYYKHLKKRK